MSSQYSKDFQDRLRHSRELKGLSQGDLAGKTGLQASAISHFESGRRAPSFENLRRLADALSVSTDYLLGREAEVGASGPVVQSMFRDVENLSARDLQTLADFAKLLSDKSKPKQNGE
jgi:transcriptional regulator with XRE-family HTH domain